MTVSLDCYSSDSQLQCDITKAINSLHFFFKFHIKFNHRRFLCSAITLAVIMVVWMRSSIISTTYLDIEMFKIDRSLWVSQMKAIKFTVDFPVFIFSPCLTILLPAGNAILLWSTHLTFSHRNEYIKAFQMAHIFSIEPDSLPHICPTVAFARVALSRICLYI